VYHATAFFFSALRKTHSPLHRQLGEHGIICQSPRVDGVCPLPTRNVVLTDHQAHLIDALVSSGRFQNASEVLRAGLRLVEREEAEAQARLEALRNAAHAGISDADAGRLRSFTSAQALGDYLDELAENAVKATSPAASTAKRTR
jgi:antitoxin ParD1/3/4